MRESAGKKSQVGFHDETQTRHTYDAKRWMKPLRKKAQMLVSDQNVKNHLQ